MLVLAFGSGRRTYACGAVLRVAATCGSVLGLIVVLVVLVVAVRSPAAVGTAVTSRASVVVGV